MASSRSSWTAFRAFVARHRVPALVTLGVLALLVGGALLYDVRRGDDPERIKPRLSTLPGLPTTGQTDSGAADAVSILPADEARRRNRAVAFVKGPVPAASPFRFAGNEADRGRARECLATAMLYEAGLDGKGQRAVAQVILNRVRHPAFPGTVCGVVYQGSERSTGCQFTFTCDGALRRVQPASWMNEARKRADEMLDGSVFRDVGLATHYHTDWVYPYWSASLDKVAAVDTHLFFRWRNFWGTRAAFTKVYRGDEPQARPSPAASEAAGTPTDDASSPAEAAPGQAIPTISVPPPPAIPPSALRGDSLRLTHPDGNAYILVLREAGRAEEHMGVALRLCRAKATCQVMGWLERDPVPGAFPVAAESRAAMRFSYVRDRSKGHEELRFDCKLFPRQDNRQCLP